MKYHLLFLVGVLFLNSGQAKIAKGHGHPNTAKQDRAASENGSTTVASHNTTQVYQLSGNESVYLNYNESSCYYGIWSPTKHLALLYASKDRLVGVYNTSSTSLLTISTSSNHVTLRANTTIEFTTDTLPQAFSRMYHFMLESRTNTTGDGTLSVDISLSGLLDISQQNQCQGNCDFFRCLINSFGRYIDELRTNISNGFSGFGTLFAPPFSIAGNVADAFYRIFGAAIQRGVGLPRILVQAFGVALGRGSLFLNTNLIGQLSNAIRATGSFFGNITDALRQVFVGGGITHFNSSTIRDGNRNLTINSLITGDNSWLIQIGNNTVNMTVNYNSHHNFFALFNRDMNISVVFDGSTAFYAIFNTSSGVGCVISQSTGNARVVVDTSGRIHNAFEGRSNFTNGFILIDRAIENNSDGLNNLFNLDYRVFSFRLVVVLLRAGVGIDAAFLGKNQLLQTVRSNFGGLFNAAHDYFQRSDSGFDFSLGPLNILFPILRFRGFINNFIPIIRDIFGFLGGMFNPALFGNIGTTFLSNFGSLANRFIFDGLSSAFNTTRHFSGGINNVINGILGAIPSGEVDVEFKMGPQCSCRNNSNGNH